MQPGKGVCPLRPIEQQRGRRERTSRRHHRALGALLLASALLIAGAGAAPAADPGPTGDEAFRAQLQVIVDQLPDPEGADDAEQMRSLVGLPDAFTIAFETADDGSISRREQWFYYDLSTVLELVDGELLWNLPLDEEVGSLVHADRYDPAAFTPDSTWDSLAAVVGDPSAFESVALDSEYQVPATIYVGNLLLLAFDDDGRLFYAEATPLTPESAS